MIHYGDIRELSGYDVPAVDVIIGGSPCQDLSCAGKRAGLAGERSGLFLEQIRVVKEMWHATDELVPRYMVWENVPGALSTNGGEDFRTVLEETARVAEESVSVPGPPERWTPAGAIMADRWSVAWRVLDSQYWGVPQRRRRIALVADFGGQSAGEILFNSEIGSGNTAQAEESCGGGTTVNTDDSRVLCMATGQADAEIMNDKSPTLVAGHERPIVFFPESSTARRVTPLECERMQGYPDGWTDIGEWVDSSGKVRRPSDSSRYRALGNSIALPPWKWVLKRICARYERDATMGSLFDGIGGFPLIWERLNGKGSCLWTSEIDEFAIAVSRFHFG